MEEHSNWKGKTQMEEKRTMITGMGMISSISRNADEFAEALLEGKTGVCFQENRKDELFLSSIRAEIRDVSYQNCIMDYNGLPPERINKLKQCVRRASNRIQCAALASLEAWEEALLDTKPVPGERMGIIVAGSNLSQQDTYRLYKKFDENPEYLPPSYALHFMDTDCVGILSEVFQIKGEGFTIGGASASGNMAIIKAMQLIKMGCVDLCMVVGVPAGLSPMEFLSFENIGALGGKSFVNEPERACRPFDKKHEGFIYGEAGTCLILEDSQSAARRGAVPIIELLSGAIMLDANRLSNPSEDGETRVMEAAISQAGVSLNEIDYINAHGTSTPLGDITEVNAMKRVFGKNLHKIWINSTKGMIGHCFYSAAMAEAVAVAVQMKGGFVHPNLNLENPIDTECRFCPNHAVRADLNISMSNSFGFGGINTSIILKGIN